MHVVESALDVALLLDKLTLWQWAHGFPVGLDTETTGCNPKKESPVERARLWCLTLAWGPPQKKTPGQFETAFVPAEYVSLLRPWLEAKEHHKVGSGIMRYDRHVLGNLGIQLKGIVGDTERMSRLKNPSKRVKHGLKPQGEELGYTVTEFSEIAGRRKPGALREYKKDARIEKDGVVVLRTAGAPLQNVNAGWELVDLPTLWDQYPQRREKIVQYATQDPCMSLDAWYARQGELREVAW